MQVYELQQMSIGIAGQVREYINGTAVGSDITSQQISSWGKWVERQESKHCSRAWYESNLSLLGACS